MTSLINEQILTHELNITSSDLNKDIDNIIKLKLVDELENKCQKQGLIMKNSISIIKRSIGNVSTHNNNSCIKYNITFKCKVLNPLEGDIIESFVNNKNKMGVISYIKIKDTDEFIDSPLIIIIPIEYLEEASININDINIKQKINVEILGSRIKYLSDKIQIVAKPV